MSKSSEKKELILEKAKQVFIRDGFHNVTMKDIIDECQISRGGLYLYFSSVDEIFKEVVKTHNQSRLEKIKLDIKESSDFSELIEQYLLMQKKRLLHMDSSLMLAQYEFFFAHRNEYDKDYFFRAFHNSKDIMYEILSFGAKKGYINEEIISTLADNIMFVLEGLGTLAISCGISEDLLNRQFEFIKRIIFSQKEGDRNNYEYI